VSGPEVGDPGRGQGGPGGGFHEWFVAWVHMSGYTCDMGALAATNVWIPRACQEKAGLINCSAAGDVLHVMALRRLRVMYSLQTE
jgi:hypothetical protein